MDRSAAMKGWRSRKRQAAARQNVSVKYETFRERIERLAREVQAEERGLSVPSFSRPSNIRRLPGPVETLLAIFREVDAAKASLITEEERAHGGQLVRDPDQT